MPLSPLLLPSCQTAPLLRRSCRTALLLRSCQTALLLGALLPSLAGADGLAFSQVQADAGRALYRESCQICHGSTLANGQFGTPLKGSFFKDKWRGRTLGELLTFIYEKMPPDKLRSLTAEQVTAAAAYILSRNDIAASDTALPVEAVGTSTASLPW